jgi:hypothetical protein
LNQLLNGTAITNSEWMPEYYLGKFLKKLPDEFLKMVVHSNRSTGQIDKDFDLYLDLKWQLIK